MARIAARGCELVAYALSTPAAGQVEPLWHGAIDFLVDDRRDDGLFSFSAERKGDRLVRTYESPWTLRYTINTYLGLLAAARSAPDDLRLRGVERHVDEFADRWESHVTHPADLGLLTVLLCERGDDDRAEAAFARAAQASSAARDVQSVAWLLWGAAVAARRGLAGAHGATNTLLRRLLDEFADPQTGLPRHSAQRYRGGMVSFGGLVYFLRALYEAEQTLGDDRAGELFANGVRRAIDLQGDDGGWPWMLDAASGRVVDRYPLFTVHQDGMSMLFLQPAATAGLHGAAEACTRSVRWALGDNALRLRMYADEPSFVGYRAIQRAEAMPRARRYVRWLRGTEDVATPQRLLVNTECRSYHLGWLLYAWS